MSLKSVFTHAFFLAMLGLIGFTWIAIGIGEQRIDQFDRNIIVVIQGLESSSLTRIMKGFTFLGSYAAVIFIAVVMLLVLAKLRYRMELLFFVGVVSGSALLNVVLKSIFHRARPTLYRIIEETGYSFPSGHSMAAFTLYGILIFLLWKHLPRRSARVLLITIGSAIILLIGGSRIYLGVHYPSDVIGGYLASGTWLAACIGYYQYRAKRQLRNKVFSH